MFLSIYLRLYLKNGMIVAFNCVVRLNKKTDTGLSRYRSLFFISRKDFLSCTSYPWAD